MTTTTDHTKLFDELQAAATDLVSLQVNGVRPVIELTRETMDRLRAEVHGMATEALQRQIPVRGRAADPKTLCGLRLRVVDDLPDNERYRVRLDLGSVEGTDSAVIGKQIADWANQCENGKPVVYLNSERVTPEPAQGQAEPATEKPEPARGYKHMKQSSGPINAPIPPDRLVPLQAQFIKALQAEAAGPITVTTMVLPDPCPAGVNNVTMLSDIKALEDLHDALINAALSVRQAIRAHRDDAEHDDKTTGDPWDFSKPFEG